jgi:hypothetical protein
VPIAVLFSCLKYRLPNEKQFPHNDIRALNDFFAYGNLAVAQHGVTHASDPSF